MPTTEQRRKLARALATQTDIPFERALAQVTEEHRSRALPPTATRADMEAALEFLTDRRNRPGI